MIKINKTYTRTSTSKLPIAKKVENKITKAEQKIKSVYDLSTEELGYFTIKTPDGDRIVKTVFTR